MEAKLKKAEFDCYDRSYAILQRKEESRDAVVPDTLPDIAEVLYCGGKVLIRSKDVSAGRVRIEANVPANVLYKGEDGKVCAMEITVPVFFSAEDENISDEAIATAQLKLLSLEARAVNPRKILVRAEVSAEIWAYEARKISVCQGVEDDEHIQCRYSSREISIVQAVTEKTFALSDEISLPPAGEGASAVFCTGIDCNVDEIKAVGSKIIVKGRLKSALLFINGLGQLCHLEPVTDFSQIIELGCEAGTGISLVWITPSGAYCSISSENEGRIGLEYHMVAQLVCRSNLELCYVDEAFSNSYELELSRDKIKTERSSESGKIRESIRQLFETARSLGEVLYSRVFPGKPIFEKDKMLLPISFTAVCMGTEGPWCEKRMCEIAFRLPPDEVDYSLKNLEIADWAVLPVPGGMELRVEAAAELFAREEGEVLSVSSIQYDHDKPLDNSGKPSLVLLRLGSEHELWNLARENCSSVEAILEANGLEDVSAAIGKLILIPKTN